MTALLEARNVTKIFSAGLLNKEETVALRDFSFQISGETPSVTAIVGESGSGKTTLVRMLLWLASPTTGEVLFRGKNLNDLTAADHRTFLTEVQAIFQDPFEVFNPFYKVDHVLESPLQNFGLAKSRTQRLWPRSVCGPRKPWAAIPTTCAAASGSGSWWRGPSCSSRG